MQDDKILKGIKSGIEDLDNTPVGSLESLERRAKEAKEREEKQDAAKTSRSTNSLFGDIFKAREDTGNLVGVTVTLRKDQIKDMDKICKATNKNRSEFIRELIDIAISSNK